MRATLFRPALAAMALSALLFAGVPAFAEMVSYKAELKATTEVPPNDCFASTVFGCDPYPQDQRALIAAVRLGRALSPQSQTSSYLPGWQSESSTTDMQVNFLKDAASEELGTIMSRGYRPRLVPLGVPARH
jgi:hypothetical protein